MKTYTCRSPSRHQLEQHRASFNTVQYSLGPITWNEATKDWYFTYQVWSLD